MVDVLLGIGKAIVGLIDLVFSFIQDLVFIVQLLGSLIVKLPMMFFWLPSAVGSLIILILSIVIIYKVAGREG